MITAFCAVASLLFLFLGVIWNGSNWFNATIKVTLIAVLLWGVICTLASAGFILHQ